MPLIAKCPSCQTQYQLKEEFAARTAEAPEVLQEFPARSPSSRGRNRRQLDRMRRHRQRAQTAAAPSPAAKPSTARYSRPKCLPDRLARRGNRSGTEAQVFESSARATSARAPSAQHQSRREGCHEALPALRLARAGG